MYTPSSDLRQGGGRVATAGSENGQALHVGAAHVIVIIVIIIIIIIVVVVFCCQREQEIPFQFLRAATYSIVTGAADCVNCCCCDDDNGFRFS